MGVLLSGVTVVRNALINGYPFVESILSLLPAVDELVVLEGHSDDDTWDYLLRLQQRHPKIRLHRQPWPQGLQAGRSIGLMQTDAFHLCRGRWCFLLQADEILPEENAAYLRALCQRRRWWEVLVGRRRFNSYAVDVVHVFDSFQRWNRQYGSTATQPYGTRWAVRLVRRRPLIFSGGDGWSFEGWGLFLIGTARLPAPLFHVGHNFPVNRIRKHRSHAKLYPESDFGPIIRQEEQDLADYQSGAKAMPRTNPLELPPIMVPLIGALEYQVREELLD